MRIPNINLFKKVIFKNLPIDLKLTEFQQLHRRPSIKFTVIGLEERLKKIGYSVTFEDNEETGRIITNLYERFSKAGIKLPNEIILFTPKSEGMWALRPFVPNGKNSLNVPIYFNKNLAKVENPEHIVYHEIGHFLHEKTALKPEMAKEIWNKLGYDTDLLKEVGSYAMMGDRFEINIGKEFVAEVFAGMLSGKKYSKKVMSLYEALGGPKIEGLTNNGLSANMPQRSYISPSDCFKFQRISVASKIYPKSIQVHKDLYKDTFKLSETITQLSNFPSKLSQTQ